MLSQVPVGAAVPVLVVAAVQAAAVAERQVLPAVVAQLLDAACTELLTVVAAVRSTLVLFALAHSLALAPLLSVADPVESAPVPAGAPPSPPMTSYASLICATTSCPHISAA